MLEQRKGNQGAGLAGALECAKRGFHVIPVEGKVPLVKDWPEKASADAEVIRELWSSNEEASVGVVTGAKSGVFVIDVDDKLDGRGSASLIELERTYGPLPTTLVARTGNGLHFYFRHPGFPVKNRVSKLGPGLDVRGDRGFVVAPPSLHANGNRYEWIDADQEISAAPEWLLELIRTESLPAKTSTNSLIDDNEIPDGQRNDRLFRIACSMRGSGMDREDIEIALHEINSLRCIPPLEEEEVRKIASSAAEYAPGKGVTRPCPLTEDSPLSWFPLDVRVFLADGHIVLMSDYQIGWYIRLLVFAWQNGGMLDDDPEMLLQLARPKSRKKFEAEKHMVLYAFEKTIIDGRPMLVHTKLAAKFAERYAKWNQTKRAAEESRRKRQAQMAAASQGQVGEVTAELPALQ
jgi:uncharacterized protein YdaU (DUF1376 family)